MIEGTTHKALVEKTPTKYREHLQKAFFTNSQSFLEGQNNQKRREVYE